MKKKIIICILVIFSIASFVYSQVTKTIGVIPNIVDGALTGADATGRMWILNPTINKSAGDDIALTIQRNDVSSPGSSYFVDFNNGGASQFYIDSIGNVNAAGNITAPGGTITAGSRVKGLYINGVRLTEGEAVSILETVPTAGGNIYYILQQDRIVTTDAAVTTIIAVTIGADQTALFSANVTARRTGGAAGAAGDSGGYNIRGLFKRIGGGGVIQIGATAKQVFEDQAGWDADFAAVGNDVQVVVTGAVNNDIVWHLNLHTEGAVTN